MSTHERSRSFQFLKIHRWVCALGAAVLLLGTAPAATAQLISIKSVPIAEGDQFRIFPSRNAGMGGLSIAVTDPLLDPFINPAKGSRLTGTRLFGSPAFYDVSAQSGGGRTLPLGVLHSSRGWFGGLTLAMQEIEPAQRDQFFFRPELAPELLREQSRTNQYAFGTVGKRVADQNLSIAASVFWAGLDAVDGVDLLYAGSQGIDQSGNALDARLGVLKEWPGDRSLEALFVLNRWDMTHDVTYIDFRWDPAIRQTVTRQRDEHNVDRTNTWGLHFEYEQPLTATGWRVGGLVTGNYKTHPKIPNYEIMNIPRDPGFSQAYNIGVGLSRSREQGVVGIEVIYEPIWSDTWADADVPRWRRDGGTIPAGGRTVENEFRFSNALLRMGVGHDLELSGTSDRWLGLQLGLAVRSIHYWLRQVDNVELTKRHQEESWTEWSPSWGTSLRFPDFEIRYTGRSTSGVGRPGVASEFRPGIQTLSSRDVLLAPSGPLTLQDVRVTTHQVSVSVPIR